MPLEVADLTQSDIQQPHLSLAVGLRSETLHLLDWARLCEHVSTFASSKIGSLACQTLDPWVTQATSERWLTETQEGIDLESRLPGGLSLQGIHDLLPDLQRAERGGILSGEALLRLATTLNTARRARRTIDEADGLTQLPDLVSTLRTYPELEQAILNTLGQDGTVKDTASHTLFQLRQSIRGQRQQIQSRLQRILSEKANAIQEATMTQREGRYVIPVKASHKDQIRGLVHDSSSTGATLFLEPYSVVEANNHLRRLLQQARIEEEAILQALSEQVGAAAGDLAHLQQVMTELDRALARGRYSLWVEGSWPQFVSNSPSGGDPAQRLSLRQVRHPLLVWQAQHEQGFRVVPMDWRLDPSLRVVVITGPNTGGKTVALKTLGLAVLMAKAGIFVPAREPVGIPWVDTIYADIGDEQSLQHNLSTFSGHIRRISRIVKALPHSPDSLVLLDEVGAGTDPTEGAVLAAALLEHFAQAATLTIATTHYGELKALKYRHPGFENASVEFNEATLSPTYRLLWGIPGRSNALTIAERLQLDPQIVAQARTYLQGDNQEVNAVIEGLERQRSDLENRTQQAEKLHQELETLRQQMQHRYRRLVDQEYALDRERTQGIQAAIQEARTEVAKIIRKLQKQGDPNAVQQANRELERLEQAVVIPPAPEEMEFFPQVGDRVRLRGFDQIGEVIAISGEEFTVRSGLLKFSVALHQLSPIDDHQAKQRQRVKPNPPPPPAPLQIRTSRNTFDLRGHNVMDAEQVLDQAIAAADPGPIWIIHGHGTGRLRAGVHEYLRAHRRVKAFETADPEDGGSGVTVAQLG